MVQFIYMSVICALQEGNALPTHQLHTMLPYPYFTQGSALHATSNALSVIAGRVSFVFGLHGPAVSVDTACSAALVAMHIGMCGVMDSQVGSALIGGVHVQAAPTSTAYVSAAGMLSPHGR